MKGRIVTGPERAQEQARRAVRSARMRAFGKQEESRTVPERGAAVVTAVMRARERPPWWRRLWAWVRSFG